jgi:hypothetical protein
MLVSGGSGGFTMDLPWIYHGVTMDLPLVYHGFTMDFHGEINGQLVVNQPSSYWDLPLMYHAYVFDIEIVQSKQRKCASTFWSSFLDEPSLYICWDHVIHELFFPYENQP